jgi:hypothetical protein
MARVRNSLRTRSSVHLWVLNLSSLSHLLSSRRAGNAPATPRAGQARLGRIDRSRLESAVPVRSIASCPGIARSISPYTFCPVEINRHRSSLPAARASSRVPFTVPILTWTAPTERVHFHLPLLSAWADTSKSFGSYISLMFWNMRPAPVLFHLGILPQSNWPTTPD